jgi:hypothetical protein
MSFIDIVRSAGNIQGVIGEVRNIADSILQLFGVDVVGIYDNDTFEQIFNTARPMKANISRVAKIMEHPIETGSIIQDFMIVQPVDIELSLLLQGDEYQAVYQLIKGYFYGAIPIAIQTKTDVFSNMLIQAMPSEESPEMFDVIPLALKLREIQLVTVQYQQLNEQQAPAPEDQSTVNTGTQQPKESALYQIANFIGGIFK